MSTMANGDAKKGSVTALVRGLRILQCFNSPGRELTVSEIARQVGLSQPTTWRLCNTLLDCGFLVKSPTGSALRVGAPALTLGYAAIRGQDLPAIARPYMTQAATQLDATITLGLCTGLEMVSVEQINGSFVVANQPVGWRAAITSVPSGLSVLAIMEDDERAAAMAAVEARDPQAWPRRLARMQQARDQFDRDGYVSHVMINGQYTAVAVPLVEGSASPRRYWTLSCGGLRSQWSDEALASAATRLKEIRHLIQPAAAVLAAVA